MTWPDLCFIAAAVLALLDGVSARAWRVVRPLNRTALALMFVAVGLLLAGTWLGGKISP